MAFLDLVDRSGRIQLQARVDELGEEAMDQLLDLDLGDLIGVDGTALRSRRGAISAEMTAEALGDHEVVGGQLRDGAVAEPEER